MDTNYDFDDIISFESDIPQLDNSSGPAVTPIPNFDDTAQLRTNKEEMRVKPVPTVAEDMHVYGLVDNKGDQQARHDRKRIVAMVAGGCAAAALILGALHVIQPFGGSKTSVTTEETIQVEQTAEDAQPQEEPEPDVTEEPVEEPAPDAFSSDEVLALVQSLSFNGENVGVSPDTCEAHVAGSRVLVIHRINENYDISPSTLMGRAGQRAASTLSALLKSQQESSDEVQTPVSDLTWVVANNAGEPFFAVRYDADSIPESGSLAEVLSAASGMVTSTGLRYAVGREGASMPEDTATVPVNLDGQEIAPTAYLPRFGTGA